jgi:integrase
MTWPIRYMLVHLALNSGLRVSEIAKLKIQDVKLSIKSPYIFVRNGKRGKSRDVYIDRELTKHLQEFILQKKNWNQFTEPEAPLFSGHGGQHSTTTALYISFKQAVREAGLRNDLTIHSARHGYATLLYYKTKDLRAVQKQLGHSSLNMTSLYADIMPEENGEIANKTLDN